MRGIINDLLKDDVLEFNEFLLLRPYDHSTIVYDNLDRVTSAEYWVDAGETVLLESFTITYSVDGHPIVDGGELKNHILDIYSGKFVINDSVNKKLLQDNNGIKRTS